MGQIGQVAWPGPSAHQDFVRGQGSVGGTGSFTRVVLIARLPHFNFARRDGRLATGDGGVTIDVFDLVLLEEERNTTV